METDTHCPSCRSPVGRATAAAPGEMGKKPNALLMMLPVFGGAAGGLLAGAIQAASADTPSARRPFGGASATAATGRSGSSSAAKILVGLVFLFGGGFLLFIGGREVWDTWNVSRRPATEVTAAELGRVDFAKSAPDWIRFTFAESKPTPVGVKRKRQGGDVEAEARCLLVRVQDKWLLATVPPNFQGNDLVGYVVPFDPVAVRPVLEQIVQAEPKVRGILPFEFHAVEGSAEDQRLRNMSAALLGFFGLLGVLVGVCLIPFGGRPAAPATAPLGPAVPPTAVEQSWGSR
jgi:hypothetical protein